MKRVIFLFETTGYAAKCFKERGWYTTIIDIKNVGTAATNENADVTLSWDILEKEQDIIELGKGAALIFGFPPCTDLAVSGARHFAAKKKRNPLFQEEAVNLARSVERIGNACNADWGLENPVSVLATMWRPPNFYFHPFQFGGYLPEDDVHPDYPQYIKPRDAYPKNTGIWHSPNFRVPKRKHVPRNMGYSAQHNKLGGKSEKTKRIRSASPRGFFTALAEVYST